MAVTLITGGEGFTGRYLAAELAKAGDEVHSLDRHPSAGDIEGIVRSHRASLLDAERVREIVADIRPQRVVHLAAIAFAAHDDIDELYSTNIIGSRNLLEALASHGGDLESVMLASSANVYGDHDGVIGEETPPAPANDYGVTKTAMEYVARTYADRLPLIVARPFNYTGVGQAPNFLIPKIVDHTRRRAEGIELGNIDVARDFSDVRSVVSAYAALLSSAAALGGTFNICSGKATSLRQVIAMVEKLSGHVLPVTVNPDFVRENEVKELCGDRARLDSVIGSLDTPSLEDTLRWMLES